MNVQTQIQPGRQQSPPSALLYHQKHCPSPQGPGPHSPQRSGSLYATILQECPPGKTKLKKYLTTLWLKAVCKIEPLKVPIEILFIYILNFFFIVGSITESLPHIPPPVRPSPHQCLCPRSKASILQVLNEKISPSFVLSQFTFLVHLARASLE